MADTDTGVATAAIHPDLISDSLHLTVMRISAIAAVSVVQAMGLPVMAVAIAVMAAATAAVMAVAMADLVAAVSRAQQASTYVRYSNSVSTVVSDNRCISQ